MPDIDTYTHNDKERVNIPKAELGHRDDSPNVTQKYSFDPHSNPTLQWTGKQEQDSFNVTTTSIHVHEIVRPINVIGAVLKPRENRQLTLFNDVPDVESILHAVEAYQHNEKWTNRMIAGDSLVIMNSLLQKEAMAGKVQMIYIDPPYGIKYGSNFQPFVNKRDVKDSDSDLTTEPETIKAFRDTWELGIHSYLTYLRSRLLLARELLTDSGSVFVQISDENVHHVREICDEIFGPENFVTTIKFKKTGSIWSNLIASTTDYLIWYAKDKAQVKYHQLYVERKAGDPSLDMYSNVENKDGYVRRVTFEELSDKKFINSNRIFRYTALVSAGSIGNSTQSIEFEGETFTPRKGNHWKTTIEGMQRLIEAGRVSKNGKTLRYKRYLADSPLMQLDDFWDDTGGVGEILYAVQTTTKVIQRCMLMTTDSGDLVLDITCGSGTTAYVAEQWGRRWITCDTSRIALAIARQRLTTATFDYYKLAKPEAGISGGFVYKTVPHVTLKSIANNEKPETEILYDQPEKDNKKVRVTGPFTIEALPAPVVFSVDEAANLPDDLDDVNEGSQQSNWREQLLSTGIMMNNNERLRFARVDAVKGARWLNAEAETDEETPRRAVICFSDEKSLMDKRRVSEALTEALAFSSRPEILIFAGFQFDAVAAEEIHKIMDSGKIEALQVNMNPDLMTSDLKRKLSMDQSFWLVGQPDIELVKCGEKYRVKVKGFAYYDMTKHEVIAGNANKIAMWLLDTNYDGLQLNPTQIFFLMNGGWEKLAKTLRAEINEELIESYSGTESLEFEAEEGQQIAVKIIDDRGIESMRVLTC